MRVCYCCSCSDTLVGWSETGPVLQVEAVLLCATTPMSIQRFCVVIMLERKNSAADMQRATDVVMKDTLLPQEALQQLGNEHKAVLDFLVLMRATRVVGFLGSTFSQQLRLYRAISDPSPDGSTVMVGDIGQNGLQHTPEVQAIIDAGMQVLFFVSCS